jgi:hypothetical protein
MRHVEEEEKRKRSVFAGLGGWWLWSGGPGSNTVYLQICMEAENLSVKRHTSPAYSRSGSVENRH